MRIKRNIIYLVAMSILILATAHALGENLTGVFSQPKQVTWSTSPHSLPHPTFINNEYGTGFKFSCDFTDVNPSYPRCYWDASFKPVDLSKQVTIVMKAQIKNSNSLTRIAFYLHNDKTWYLSRSMAALGDGMNTLTFQLADYRADGGGKRLGKSNPFNQVDKIRINFFPRGKSSANPPEITIYNIRASATKVEAGDGPLFTPPQGEKLSPKKKYDKNGQLLETRMILDESGSFLKYGNKKVLNDLSQAGFNAYMPAIWHGRGAIYRSKQTKTEPRFAKYFTDKDAFAELIKAAHARSIEVHGWFCVAYRGRPDAHPEFATEGVPEGAYDLQDPAFRDFIVREIVDFALKYDVDGVNLDYIRTKGVSFSKIAAEQYRKKYNADINELKNRSKDAKIEQRFLEWQRDAVSDIVRRISAGIKAKKPNLVISICGHLLKKPQLQAQGRNSWLWAEEGWINIAYNMDYNWRPDFDKFDASRHSTTVPDKFVLMLGNYELKGRKALPRNAEQVARLVDYALTRFPYRGVAFYSYERLDAAQIKALRNGPFKTPANPYWGEQNK
ncbi:MAG: family 10 glycosylhydrolase [Victivallaceae bacterium]|nr:family 10 glycosylhydrolase [Victivallaceae bacterium]